MASITSLGLGSGLDVRKVIDDMLSAEGKARSEQLDTKEVNSLNKISAYGSLKSSLFDFQTALSSLKSSTGVFNARKTTSQKEEYFKAVANSSATPGAYSIKVVDLAYAKKAASIDFGSASSVIGTGTLRFTIGSATHDININTSNQTVAGIRDAVNQVSLTTGVSASIVTSDTGTKLVFSSTKTGTDSVFVVSVIDDNDGNNNDNMGLSQLKESNLHITQPAANAEVEIDGLTVTSQSNSVSGAIEGVTLDLIATSQGAAYNLTIDNDRTATLDALDKFVKAYNSLADTIKNLGMYQKKLPGADASLADKSSDDKTAQVGVLLGDATLRSIDTIIKRQLGSITSNPDGFSTLAEIGIKTNAKTGKLEVDISKVTESLANNFDAIGDYFTDPQNGITAKLDTAINSIIGDKGLLSVRTDGLRNSIDGIAVDRIKLESYLKSLETRLLRQFSVMDSIVAQLQNTSAFLQQQVKGFVDPLAFRK